MQGILDKSKAKGCEVTLPVDKGRAQHFIAFVNFNGMVFELDGRNIHVRGRRPNPRRRSSAAARALWHLAQY